MGIWERNVLSKGNSKSKCPEAGVCADVFKNNKESNMGEMQ